MLGASSDFGADFFLCSQYPSRSDLINATEQEEIMEHYMYAVPQVETIYLIN